MAKKIKVTSKIVNYSANLAKIKVKKSEVNKFKNQLTNIFDYVDQVGKLKTSGIKATSHVTGTSNRYRDDKVEPDRILSQKQALSQAKKIHNGYFVVKSVFDK